MNDTHLDPVRADRTRHNTWNAYTQQKPQKSVSPNSREHKSS
ncbi:MAG TPA: hypothetical protein PKM73_16390 [Verrucomicrobiota bacterium]|nr:hypothetical protein [Verrucomicrobiota bacterium]